MTSIVSRGVLLLVLAACAGDDPGGSRSVAAGTTPILPDTQTVDGILVMRHGADAFARAPRWVLDSVPEVVIDGGDAFDLTWVSRPVMLSDGRAVALSIIGSPRLALFDGGGRFVRVIAEGGQGPGELSRPSDPILLTGDTLVIANGGNSAVSWYHPDDGVIRTAPADAVNRTSCYRRASRLTTGRLVALYGCMPYQSNDSFVARPLVSLAGFDFGYAAFDTLAMIPGWEVRQVDSRRGGARRVEQQQVRLGLAPSLTTMGERIVLATADSGYRVHLLDQAGAAVGRVEVVAPRRPVTSLMRQIVIDRELAEIDGPQMESRVDAAEDRRQAREAYFPDSLPPYSNVEAGGDEAFWVLDYIAPGDSTWSATAFRADGAILGRLQGPITGTEVWQGPVRFERDRVIVREVDGDGVVRFGAYGMSPSD